MKPKKKLFVVRKYVLASSVQDALRVEKVTPPHDVWLDDDWKKSNIDDNNSDTFGFKS